MRKMKILAISPFAAMKGGCNKSFLMVLAGLKKDFHTEITVVLPEQGELTRKLDELEIGWRVFRWHSANVINQWDVKHYLQYFYNSLILLYDSRMIRKIITAVGDTHFDAVYINDVSPQIGGLLSNALHVPNIWHCYYSQLIWSAANRAGL